LSSLFIVLKDHNNDGLKTKQAVSQSRILRSAAEEDGFVMNYVQLKEKNLKNACMWLNSRMRSSIAKELKLGIKKLGHLIDVNVVDQTCQGKNC